MCVGRKQGTMAFSMFFALWALKPKPSLYPTSPHQTVYDGTAEHSF